jgi:hypothetical protein
VAIHQTTLQTPHHRLLMTGIKRVCMSDEREKASADLPFESHFVCYVLVLKLAMAVVEMRAVCVQWWQCVVETGVVRNQSWQ